jgi:hypothetical protein
MEEELAQLNAIYHRVQAASSLEAAEIFSRIRSGAAAVDIFNEVNENRHWQLHVEQDGQIGDFAEYETRRMPTINDILCHGNHQCQMKRRDPVDRIG